MIEEEYYNHYLEEEYDEDGNPIDPCESEYEGYDGDGMDVDMNCLDYLIAKNCFYCFGNPNVADEWCSFMCHVRGPCHLFEEECE
jgi:hypothetical protein